MSYSEYLRSIVPEEAIHSLELLVVDSNLQVLFETKVEPSDEILTLLQNEHKECSFLGVLTDINASTKLQRTILVFQGAFDQWKPRIGYVDKEFVDALSVLGKDRHFATARNDQLRNSMEYWRLCRRHLGKALLFTPAAGALIQDDEGRVLLQRRTDDGTWGILGGSMEIGETPMEAAIREVLEESGLSVEIDRLLSVATGDDCFVRYPNGDLLKFWGFLFLARVVGGEINPDPEETAELRWFAQEELAELSTMNLYARMNVPNISNESPKVLGLKAGTDFQRTKFST